MWGTTSFDNVGPHRPDEPKVPIKELVDENGFIKFESFTITCAGKSIAFRPEQLKIIRHICSGGFGSCLQAEDSKGRSVAIKIIATKIWQGQQYEEWHAANVAQQEIDVAISPRFVNLPQNSGFVQCLGYGELSPEIGPKFGLDIGKVLVYEWANAGDLDTVISRLHTTKTWLPEGLIWQWLVQIVEAANHLSAPFNAPVVIHDDIKPDNIFLTFSENDPTGIASWPSLKIGDFGLTKEITRKDGYRITQNGIGPHTSPDWPRKSPKSELFEFVHVLYLCCSQGSPARRRDLPQMNRGKDPFKDCDMYSAQMLSLCNNFQTVVHPVAHYSQELNDFFKYVLVHDNLQRPTPSQALSQLCKVKARVRAQRFEPVAAGIFMDYQERLVAEKCL